MGMEKWIRTQYFDFFTKGKLKVCSAKTCDWALKPLDLSLYSETIKEWGLKIYPQIINITSGYGVEDGWYIVPSHSETTTSPFSLPFNSYSSFGLSPSYQFFRESNPNLQTRFTPSAHFSQPYVSNHSLHLNCGDELLDCGRSLGVSLGHKGGIIFVCVTALFLALGV